MHAPYKGRSRADCTDTLRSFENSLMPWREIFERVRSFAFLLLRISSESSCHSKNSYTMQECFRRSLSSCTRPAAVPRSGRKGRKSQKEEGDKNLGIILQKNRSFSSIISHSNHSNFRRQFVQRALCPPSLFHYDPMLIAI